MWYGCLGVVWFEQILNLFDKEWFTWRLIVSNLSYNKKGFNSDGIEVNGCENTWFVGWNWESESEGDK